LKVLITVKAYPGVGRTAGEAICVAGVRLDSDTPTWVRLWPVGFRELEASAQFKKWQIVDVQAAATASDKRPESFRPDVSTLKLGAQVNTKSNWVERRRLLGPLLGQTTLCDLMRLQGQPGAPSLGLVKVRDGATATIIDGPIWGGDKELLAQLSAAPNLLRNTQLAPIKPPPFQVRYQWHCMHADCPGHQHSSCDWEVGAAALNWQHRYSDVRPHLLQNFGDQMLAEDKDTHFFVGNQHQRPRSFLVLGVFYPKRVDGRG
jgi:hypothetical protein